jgi:2-keto-4-pentenoate hydratase/2-oxohepta-3-ene-1,7-dioic acid hydratase in catechol pathway
MVSYVSRHITLLPGDVIFTGTRGRTKAMKAGDVVEVEVEGGVEQSSRRGRDE